MISEIHMTLIMLIGKGSIPQLTERVMTVEKNKPINK